ncbi:MAG: hypothetical protein AAF371_10825 [Pseudomonadota bacterium]
MTTLAERVAAELSRPVPPELAAIGERLLARPGAQAVVFYGAALRDPAAATASGAGPLDFYVLTDPPAPGPMGRLLPPHVSFAAEGPNGAKVAAMTRAAFRARMRRSGLDTTLWARFSQPARLVSGEAHLDEVAEAVAEGIRTARWWTAHLLDDPGRDPLEDWARLYALTYGAELRVERGAGRAVAVTAAEPGWFRDVSDLAPLPATTPEACRRARHAWARRRSAGKALNLARLLKAAFTYRGGIAYALAKVERHSGRPVELTRWQRRWPALAAPLVLWRLWREGRLR